MKTRDMYSLRPLVGAILIASVSAHSRAQPVTWDGDAGDGFWVTDANWDTDTVPGSSNEVLIPSDAGAVQIILSSELCASLSCLSSLRLSAGSIEVLGNSDVTNMVFEDGFVPTVTTGGAFTISGSSTCQLGQAKGTGSFSNAGNFDAQQFGFTSINGGNTGTWNVTIPGGYIALDGTTSFDNSGSISLLNDSQISGTGTLNNTGAIRRNGGQGFATILTRYNQSGSGALIAEGQGANLSLEGDAWNISAGSISVSNNAVINLAGSDITATRSFSPATITGTGTVALFPQNATINWPGTTESLVNGGGLQLFSGTINLTGSLSNKGLLEGRGAFVSGSGSFTNAPAGTIIVPSGNGFDLSMNATNSGTITVQGSLFLDNNAMLSHDGGTITLHDQSEISTLTGLMPGTISAGSSIELVDNGSSGAQASISARLRTTSGGIVRAINGTLTIHGGGEFAGGTFSLLAMSTTTKLLIEGNSSTLFTITGDTKLDTPAGLHIADYHIGSNTFGPTLSFAQGKKMTIEDGACVYLNNGLLTGTGSLVNFGNFTWFGGNIENTIDQNELMNIEIGVSKTLKGTINNYGSLINYVIQRGSIGIDGGTINNSGQWSMSSGSSIFAQGNGGAFFNTGHLVANDPNGLTQIISCDLSNTGAVEVVSGHLAFTGSVLQLSQTDGTLTGGSWKAAAGSSISFPRSLVRFNGPGTLIGGTSEFPDMPTLTGMGQQASAELLDSNFNTDLTISEGSDLRAKGDVNINGKYSSTGGSTTTIEPGAKIQASGGMEVGELDSAADDINPIVVIARDGVPAPSIVTPLLELWGGIRVGQTGNSLVGMQGDLLMHPLSRVHIKVMGNSSDHLHIEGHATLAGILSIDASEASFAQGQTLVALSATAGISGLPDQVLVYGLPIGQGYDAVVVGNELRIIGTLACPADLSDDGQLNFFDVSAFLSAFAAQDPIADFTNDGSFNFFDVSAFLTAFGAGCP